MALFNNYEIKDSVKKECTAQQLELIETLQNFNDDIDSVSMDSIKMVIPDKFSKMFYSIDEGDIKYAQLMMKFLKIYKEFIDMMNSLTVVTAEQCAQINRIERTITDMNRKLDNITNEAIDIKKRIK